MATETFMFGEDWFRMVFQESPSGIAFLNPDLHFLLANPKFSKLTGYREDELIPPCSPVSCPLQQGRWKEMTVLDVIAPADQPQVSEAFRKAAKNGDPGLIPCDVRQTDGTAISVLLKIATIKKRGKRSGLIVFLQKEKERKGLRADLSKPLGVDASGPLINEAANDFNDLLSQILENIELIKEKGVAGGNINHHVQRALKAGRRAKDLILQLQTFSRQTRNTHRPVQIGAVIKETVEILKASMSSTIDISLNIISDALVMADPAMVHQIVMNLCSNAEYSMRSTGGRIGVKLEDVLLDARSPSVREGLKEGAYLKLTVSDTGPGLSTEMIEHIFDPAYVVKDKDKSFGMAFAAVYDIVISHGGLITVNSEIGQGSTFEILLPVLEKIQDSGEKAIIRVSGGTERILFVDDERDFAVMARELLQPLGYNVTTKTSSKEALQLFRDNPGQFDLVITDMFMPQVSGDQLAKEIYTLNPEIPIILCTGFSLLNMDVKAAEVGIRAIVRKPVILDELVRTIREVLDEKASA